MALVISLQRSTTITICYVLLVFLYAIYTKQRLYVCMNIYMYIYVYAQVYTNMYAYVYLYKLFILF